MKHRPFGKTGVKVPEIGFGAWAIGGHGPGVVGYGPADDAESIAALHRAVDLGMTFVDTSSVYGHGHSEELIGRAGIREKIFLATKCGFQDSRLEEPRAASPRGPRVHPCPGRSLVLTSRSPKSDNPPLMLMHAGLTGSSGPRSPGLPLGSVSL